MKKLIALITIIAMGFFGSSFYIEGLNFKAHKELEKLTSIPHTLHEFKDIYNNDFLLQEFLKRNQHFANYYDRYYYLNFEDYQKGFLSSSAKFSLMTKNHTNNEEVSQEIALLKGEITYYNLPLSKRFKAVFKKEGLEKVDKELANAIKNANLLEIEGFKTFFDWEVRIKSAEISYQDKVNLHSINFILLSDSKNPLMVKNSKMDLPYFKLQMDTKETLTINNFSIMQDFQTPTHLFSSNPTNNTFRAFYKEMEFNFYDYFSHKPIKIQWHNLHSNKETLITDNKLSIRSKDSIEYMSLQNSSKIELKNILSNTSIKNLDIEAWRNLSNPIHLENFLPEGLEADLDMSATFNQTKINFFANVISKDSKLSLKTNTYIEFLDLKDLLKTHLKDIHLSFGIQDVPTESLFLLAKTQNEEIFMQMLKSNIGANLDFNAIINQKDFSLTTNLKTAEDGIKLNSKITSEDDFSALNIPAFKNMLDNLNAMALKNNGKSEVNVDFSIKNNGSTFLEPTITINGKNLKEIGGINGRY
ncbi:hypothetical protein B6S12_04770 [Helicobacter valdiviensis]|uniref:DUF945 domain-containing protein n=1 Tax=Helicobacter valdiviensis TaxID=1458358 RepID=A0A2W6MUP6_9HELI|nr:hypothetical protein [Helicobacter valdiviensis]PZT48244.1 hypothetical protein B6S12_04770 [Helicobacter valdiviensis]